MRPLFTNSVSVNLLMSQEHLMIPVNNSHNFKPFINRSIPSRQHHCAVNIFIKSCFSRNKMCERSVCSHVLVHLLLKGQINICALNHVM